MYSIRRNAPFFEIMMSWHPTRFGCVIVAMICASCFSRLMKTGSFASFGLRTFTATWRFSAFCLAR